MNLYEYQAKQLLSKYNLPIPSGTVCSTLNSIPESIEKIQGPWIGKCQIHAGGRGKSGGVKLLKSKKEVESFITYWLGKHLITYQTEDTGEIVSKILLESYINILNELYFSMLIDRDHSKIICLVSTQGGIEIEKISQEMPNCIHKIFIDPIMGPQIFQGRKLGCSLGLNFNQVEQFTQIFMNAGKMFLAHDLMLVEINPLIIDTDHNLLCLDAKIQIDSNALFRQKNTFALKKIFQEDLKTSSHNNNLSDLKLNYIPMKGNIGCIVNGAGLAMATMDLLSLYGGKAANFLDIGGNVTQESVIEAVKIIIRNSKIKAILINIFGGIVCCKLIAKSIVIALSTLNITIPIVVRLEGNNAELGNKELMDSKYHIISSNNLFNAIQNVISIANRSNNNVNSN